MSQAATVHLRSLTRSERSTLKASLYQAKFSDAILQEVRASVLRRYPDARMDRTLNLVREHFGDCLVENYERLIPAMTNEPGDRHVLAAAVTCGAQLIVSDNVRDFPEECRALYNIDVRTADEFLQDLWDLDSEVVMVVASNVWCKSPRDARLLSCILSGDHLHFIVGQRDAEATTQIL